MKDPLNEALAYNLLGVNHYYLGEMDNLNSSIEFHKKHSDMTRDPSKSSLSSIFYNCDPVSRFVANLNLGITLHALGQYEDAIVHLRVALGYAIHLKDFESQVVL